MLIAHEAPISILDMVDSHTDYSYALVHLFDTHPEYYKHFKRVLATGREVLLDNSIFELKKAFDADLFAGQIDRLQPTYYIVSDVLEDGVETVANFKRWIKEYNSAPGIKIGVVQGKTLPEIVECYKYMAINADYIAISFDLSYYQSLARSNDKLIAQCEGRQSLIGHLMTNKIWEFNKPHHLLGCSLAREFSGYKGISSIRSVDTSNPVVAGILGKRYYKQLGLFDKPTTLLADLIDMQVDIDQLSDIKYNIYQFAEIVNG